MGVMGCHRRGCESVMCERYSSKFGYICTGCFDELLALGIHADVAAFMDSERNQDAEEAVFAYFNALFSLGDD